MRKASPLRRASGNAGVRCAIYTRKSSEEGLEQAFNSLDAKRGSCEAYVLSQKQEGWTTLPQMYDDGGVSGGTIERPALKRLLADIAAGKIDTVVVYKVDRLTRSLSDFAKIVEVFEAHGVSFVSVTQAFNTTSSMGRLTLNMLLSFAQFEREVTGERIRDKIAASKQKGMWMGGLPSLGYDVADRKLVINDAEAEIVRHIFRRYPDLGSVRALQEELEADGIVSKRRTDRFGRETGGKPLARGALYLMLQNRIYRGEIIHKQESYSGQHEPIIDEVLWDRVQGRLADNRIARKTGARAAEPSLLAGLVYDDAGERMTPTHANKKRTRYRYYVSQSLIKRGRAKGIDAGRRVPAGDLEGLIEDRIIAFLRDPAAMFSAIESFTENVNQVKAVVRQAAELAERWAELEPPARRLILQHLVNRIDFRRDTVDIAVWPRAIPIVVDCDLDPTHAHPGHDDSPTLILSVPARLQRAGMETRLLIEGAGGGPRREPDRSMVRLLAQAHRYREMLLTAQDKTMLELAREAGVGRPYFCRVVRLGFLAPQVIQAILHGGHPPGLTAKRLSLHRMLPPQWADQMAQLAMP